MTLYLSNESDIDDYVKSYLVKQASSQTVFTGIQHQASKQMARINLELRQNTNCIY